MRLRSFGISVSTIGRGRHQTIKKKKALPWSCGPRPPCCRVRFRKQATMYIHRAVACTVINRTSTVLLPARSKITQKEQLLISRETKTHCFARVRHRHLHGSASAPSRRSCPHSRRRRRCRPATGMKPRHRRDSRRDNLKKKTVLQDVSSEMTTRHTSLAAAIFVAQQLDGVTHHAVHLIAKVTLRVDW